MSLRDYWLKKRFRKFKKIEIETTDTLAIHKPIVVRDGDESKEGGGDLEISFEYVEKQSDIYFTLTPTEIEEIDFKEEYGIYWFNVKDCVEEEEFKVYYGCKDKWARLLDGFFMDKEKGYSDDVSMVQHLTD